MITGKDFVVFSDDWGRHPFSCQHIMQHFLPHNRVLWVNTIGMRLPRFSFYDCSRAMGKLKSWMSKSERVDLPAGLRVISPVMIPFNPISLVRYFNRKSVVGAVLKAMKDWGMREPIVLVTVPNAADYIGFVGESFVVYYCVDDFTVWPGMNLPKMVREMEHDLLRRADLVMAVSSELCKSRQGPNGLTRMLTHGVDTDHFRQAFQLQSRPEPLANIVGPIIGFYGLIDKHLDVNIISELLERRSDWTVVLIGTKRIDLNMFEKRSNFLWIPAVPYVDLPKYASAFDVSIIPYVLNCHTHTANPLKFKEYLATGKPVVTTSMAEVLDFSKHAHVVEPYEFVTAVEDALHDNVIMDERLSCLKGETWMNKAELVSSWIEESLNPAGCACEYKI